MGDDAESILQVTHCPICLLIRLRDTSQKAFSKHFDKSPPSDPDPVDSELASYSRPFELEYARHPTLSYQSALEIFHGTSSRSLEEDTSICSLCDHWVNGLFTKEWEHKEPIARITLGTFKEIEARLNCRICRLLCETISQSSFQLDDTRTLALELGGDSCERSCRYRAAAAILYKDGEEFPHSTDIEKMECPQFTVLDEIDIKPDFATPEVNWDRLQLWYSGLPSAKDRPSTPANRNYSMDTALPKGFCLINVPEARLVETDGVQVPRYAALSYVWGKSDQEIVTTMENFESLKAPGRFRQKDVPVLFRDTFEVCTQLGVDFFWIDRICVVQNDEARKSAQLEAMGRIYSKASFTIVSSEPGYISHGLPGVSQPRATSAYLCIGDKILLPRFHRESQGSAWKSRGWTYQEGLLSENVVIFDEDMVSMYSRGAGQANPEGFREFVDEKPNYISASLVPEDKQYSDQVNEYSTRLLTFGSDKVNAFLGVLNTFGEHQYGLPNRIIDQAMLWHYTYEPARAGPKFPGHEFPSWSWASTVGRIQYRHLPSKERPLFSVATWAAVELDQSSNQPLVKHLDGLQPGQSSEATQHLDTIHGPILQLETPLKTESGYGPLDLAMAANLCERYRLIQGSHGDKIYCDTPKSGTRAGVNNLAGFGRWKRFVLYLKHFFGLLGSRDQAILQLIMRAKPFRKAPWFQILGHSVSQVPEQARVDTFLRLAKPSLPNFLEQLSAAELDAALQPGRIVAHAPKMAVELKYTQRRFEGTHIWMIGYGRKLIGMAELSDPRHQELLALFSQDPSQDKVEAYCIAMSLIACRVGYTEKGRQDYSSTQESHSTVFTMIVSPPLMNCSHRLGLGFIDYPTWASLGDVPIEMTILS